jgi:ABC-type lipoprotein export system ATPase subunit
MSAEKPVVSMKDVSKEYPAASGPVRVLQAITLDVLPGETVAIVGPSGCGKSTLLNLMGALDTPDSGSIFFKERALGSLTPAELAGLRNGEIGFVFQLHHLLPQCTVLENVMLPALLVKDQRNLLQRAESLLERVGLADRKDHRPGQLSGGERQRAAVARALVNSPSLLLADEPTGSLNEEGADQLVDMLLSLSREQGMSVVMVTHSLSIAGRMDRTLEIRHGRLVTGA